MSRKGKEWIALMPEDYREKFLRNLHQETDWDLTMTNEYDDMQSMLSGAFIWAESPEGQDYWQEFAYREEWEWIDRYKTKPYGK